MKPGIAARLRHLVSLNQPEHGGPYQGAAATACVETMGKAADEIEFRDAEIARLCAELERLDESVEMQWYDEIKRLRAKVESLTLAGNALAVRHRKTFGLDGMFDPELVQWERVCREQ